MHKKNRKGLASSQTVEGNQEFVEGTCIYIYIYIPSTLAVVLSGIFSSIFNTFAATDELSRQLTCTGKCH